LSAENEIGDTLVSNGTGVADTGVKKYSGDEKLEGPALLIASTFQRYEPPGESDA
jgi:hypothetical protein